MEIGLRYGKGEHRLLLPEKWNVTILRKERMSILADPSSVLKEGLDRSLGQGPRHPQNACILICDITRPVPNGRLLPALIRNLIERGIKKENITILVATGLHRPNEGDELREVLGDEWIFREIHAANHFAGNEDDHVRLGTTARGTPIFLDRRFVRADLKIVVGLVEPHFMAGYSGGRKLIVPGVAHEKTIRKIHAAGILDHVRADNCSIDGNPLHEELIEIARKVAPVYALNVVLTDDRQMAFLNFGDLEQSHREASAFAAEYSEIAVPRPFSTVIASAAGYPLDSTYYQTVKGLVSASRILAPGGSLFIASACAEGLGSSDYRRAQELLVKAGPKGFLDEIRKRDQAQIDEWQTQMQVRAMQRGKLHLYTEGLSAQDKALTGIACVDSLEGAVMKWVNQIDDTNIAVIPEGPYLVPSCALMDTP